ncbi:MAG: sugar ABC transporter ATP-binding protein [Planctomycetes bacterium DG_58]|nr:MAG: sugar ABC transporter ATP-binding protein [Planctomycetes bacterium DG_58]
MPSTGPRSGGSPRLSENVTIRLKHVTKDYHLARVGAFGVKNLLLHLPSCLRELGRHNPFRALTDVSFEVEKGECLGIIGRNGSGKSTTLGLIAGVLRPTSGHLETHGRICPLLELGAGFHFELTGRENIVLNGVLLGMTRGEVEERMDEIIAFSELGDFVHRPVRVYSAGMVARLGFSVAVHLEPDILLVDEVLAVGDLAFQRKCLARMEDFRSNGTTMVFVSHNLADVESICNRVAFLESGRLVELGEPREVIATYKEHLRSQNL